jgi:hypothetical protein
VKKIRLLTPGPTPVSERVSLRMAQPIVHHRSPEFEEVFARCREGLARHGMLRRRKEGREVQRVDGNPHYPSYDPTTYDSYDLRPRRVLLG